VKAVTVVPGAEDSLSLRDVRVPEPGPDDLLVEGMAVGICGTDREIIEGHYGTAPPEDDYLTIGHESLGRVSQAPEGSDLKPGDLVVGVVRRPDPQPCRCCASGRWDMCLNGEYTERGIKALHGYASEIFALDRRFAIKVDEGLGRRAVLVEPASIVAKAWRKVDEFATHNCLEPKVVLITGAGPIGLLAALLARQRGFEVHVLDRVMEGPKPRLIAALGATYHAGSVADIETVPDVVVECTGAAAVVFEVLSITAGNGIVCLTGVSSPGRKLTIDAGGINRELVLDNAIVFGSVNAAREDYVSAMRSLTVADQSWLDRVLNRRVPLTNWREAYETRPEDVKVVLELS
jgi:glucose 1-dehydrogenase